MSRFPIGCGRLSQRWRIATLLAGPLHLLNPLLGHTRQPSTFANALLANALKGQGPLSMRNCGLGWNAIAIDRSLVMQTRTNKKTSKFAYRLSVIGIRRAAGNGLGRGRPTRERGQREQPNGTRPCAGVQGAKW